MTFRKLVVHSEYRTPFEADKERCLDIALFGWYIDS